MASSVPSGLIITNGAATLGWSLHPLAILPGVLAASPLRGPSVLQMGFPGMLALTDPLHPLTAGILGIIALVIGLSLLLKPTAAPRILGLIVFLLAILTPFLLGTDFLFGALLGIVGGFLVLVGAPKP